MLGHSARGSVRWFIVQEKHGWFGKYKGRINNYLSKAGYDMKKAERDMFARKKEAAATNE